MLSLNTNVKVAKCLLSLSLAACLVLAFLLENVPEIGQRVESKLSQESKRYSAIYNIK